MLSSPSLQASGVVLDNWLKWAFGGLGTAFAVGKLKFLSGDFKGMIKDPRMAGPFVKSFA